MAALKCDRPDLLRGADDPSRPLVTCATDGTAVYTLAPSIIDGSEVASAKVSLDAQPGYPVVLIEFTDSGSRTWSNFTATNVGKQVAFTLDTRVVSAPTIMSATGPGVPTQISSGSFDGESAKELATELSSGPLPVRLSVVE